MCSCGCNRTHGGLRNSLRTTLALLIAFAATPFPALAARRMTVEQLQQTLAAAQAAHRKDEELVGQLADVELTARVNSEQLQQWLASSPGPKSAAELRALADASVFLDPPPG